MVIFRLLTEYSTGGLLAFYKQLAFWVVLILGTLCFQNCGDSGSSQSASNHHGFSPQVNPDLAQVISPESLNLATNSYSPDATPPAPTAGRQANEFNSEALVISQSGVFNQTKNFEGDVIFNLPRSAETLIASGENFDREAVFCFLSSDTFTLGKITRTADQDVSASALNLNLDLHIGGCPFQLANITGVTEYIHIRANMHITGDLHIVGVVFISNGAQLKVDGSIILGTGIQNPGLVVIDGGDLLYSESEIDDFHFGTEHLDTGGVILLDGEFKRAD